MGSIVHNIHQPFGIVDNAFALSPRDGGSKKTCNLDILFSRKAPWNLNRVGVDKIESIVKKYSVVQELLDVVVICWLGHSLIYE